MRAEQAQQQRTQQEIQDRWNKVDEYMGVNYPESLAYADQMGIWADNQPEIKAVKDALLQNKNYLEASVYIWNNFKNTLPALDPATVAEQTRLEAAAQVRQEAVEAARRDAGLISGSAGGVHPTPPGQQGVTQQQIDEAARIMQATGNGASWRELTIGRDLTGPWFDGPQ
jgi:hypothetical protein